MYIVTKEMLLKLAIEGYTEIKTIVIVCGDNGETFKEAERKMKPQNIFMRWDAISFICHYLWETSFSYHDEFFVLWRYPCDSRKPNK